MASRWQFEGPRGNWEEFHVEQHEGIHAAWLGGRSTFSYSLAGNSYRADLRRLRQVNVATGTSRGLRPPSWAVRDVEVSARKLCCEQAEEAAAVLRGSEAEEPVCELRLLAIGGAISAAADVAAQLEAGAGTVCGICTDFVDAPSGGMRAPRLEVRIRGSEAVARARRKLWDRLTSAVRAEAEQVPKLNLFRLMKEFRGIERALASAAKAPHHEPPGGLVRVEPVEDSLLEWDAAMSFPEGTDLRRGLEDLATASVVPGSEGGTDSSQDAGVLLLRVRFPPDFPASPPEVWVRRPRLVHKTAPVSFGGRVCCPLLSSSGWDPARSMAGVFQEVQRVLLEPGTEVDTSVAVVRSYPAPKVPLQRLRTAAFATANSFERKGLKVMSPEMAMPFLGNVERLELTDKIALPLEYLEEICSRRALESPAMFELKTSLGRKRHCAVFDWVDGIPTGHAILPRWVMEDLCIEDWEEVHVRGVKLELVSYVKVQPHSADFYEAAAAIGIDIKTLLTESLSILSGLTEDTCVPIHIGGNTYSMQVVELRPQGAVRIIDSDVEDHFEFQVDFEPAPDLQDEAELRARQNRLLAEHRERRERQEQLARSLAERRETARRQRHSEALASAEAAAGADDGAEGAVEIALTLPNGSQVSGRFREGAPVAALEALALASPWAEEAAPFGVQLRERAPPRRILERGATIDVGLHRAAILVQEQVLQEEDEPHEPQASAARLAEPAPLPPPLVRNISQLQRRTLEAFEAHGFMVAGLEPEEAERRARSGEIAPPPSARPQPRNRPGLGPREAPRRPELHRTVSEEDRRQLHVDEVMNIVGITRAEAEEVLREHDWNVELAVNAVFDAMAGE